MDAARYEDIERYKSEQAATNFLLSSLPGEDERIVLAKASDLLDLEDVRCDPGRKGLERFSAFAFDPDSPLERFIENVRREVHSFEEELVCRDEPASKYQLN